MSDHDQFFRTLASNVLKLLAHSPRIAGHRIVRAWKYKMDGLLGHSLRPKLPRVLRKVPRQPFVMKATDENITVPPGLFNRFIGNRQLPRASRLEIARKSTSEILGSSFPARPR